MLLQSLSLTNFRNYARLQLAPSPGVTLIRGDNAQGKTNLLEAIYYLATASSPRAGADRQLINWLAETDTLPFARVAGEVTAGQQRTQLDVTLVKDVQNQRPDRPPPLQKTIRVNGVEKRVADLLGHLHVVLFLPEDIDLVAGSPGGRRRYLNALLSQVDPRYYRLLRQYSKVTYQRNHLLKRIRDNRANPDELSFWDQQMLDKGAYLIARRRQLLTQMNRYIAEVHPALTGQDETLRLSYAPSLALDPADPALSASRPLEALTEAIAARYRQALQDQRRQEIGRGVSVVGPHRDDVQFLANGVDLNVYGSRGQQRTAALSLKLAEVSWVCQETGEMPVLLLDDLVSELDPHRRRYLLDTLARAQQVLVTTTDTYGFPEAFMAEATLFQVEAGQLRPFGRE